MTTRLIHHKRSSQTKINHAIRQQKQSSNQNQRHSRQRTRKKKAPSKNG